MTTTLTQASQQWISRPANERFTSLIDMQAFKSRIRDNSASQVISSRNLQLQPSGKSPHALQILGPNGVPAVSTHWSFGQLCSLASRGNSPASYFRETRMPAPVIADSQPTARGARSKPPLQRAMCPSAKAGHFATTARWPKSSPPRPQQPDAFTLQICGSGGSRRQIHP